MRVRATLFVCIIQDVYRMTRLNKIERIVFRKYLSLLRTIHTLYLGPQVFTKLAPLGDAYFAITTRRIVDGLDALVKNVQDKAFYVQTIGFPVGIRFEKENKYLLLNHIIINIQYHVVEDGNRVVGVSVDVRRYASDQTACKPHLHGLTGLRPLLVFGLQPTVLRKQERRRDHPSSR